LIDEDRHWDGGLRGPWRSGLFVARSLPGRIPPPKPLIRFEAVVKRFGAFVAVDAVNLDIYEREFFCLLGPSGCRRNHLDADAGGVRAPTSGRILLAGQDISAVPPYRAGQHDVSILCSVSTYECGKQYRLRLEAGRSS
jgi:energy-coupling factor transporter ATP-binding protein EcfA2